MFTRITEKLNLIVSLHQVEKKLGSSPNGITQAEVEKRTTGLLSMLAERFRESAVERVPQNSLVVLPFTNLGATEVAPLYGVALADAIAAQIRRLQAVTPAGNTP